MMKKPRRKIDATLKAKIALEVLQTILDSVAPVSGKCEIRRMSAQISM
jgi:hypothetical protein